MRFKALDGMRGMAAFSIVVYHAHYGHYFEWMWTMVDMFFVLSGFLIARIVIRSMLAGNFSFRSFFIRRAIRIWPVYYITLLGCYAAVVLHFLKYGTWIHTEGLATAPFFLQYTHHYLADGMMGESEQFILWFHHSWSLAVEEQFYLLLPLVLMLLYRRVWLFSGLMIAVLATAVMVRYAGAFPLLLISRMDALAIGVLIAVYWVYAEERPDTSVKLRIRRHHVLLIAITAAALIFSNVDWGGFTNNPDVPGDVVLRRRALGLLGFNLLYGCMVICALKQWLGVFRWLFESSVAVFVGGISYALYMFHVPIRGALLSVFESGTISNMPIWGQALYFTLAVMLAWLSKVLLENRVARFKRYFPLDVVSGRSATDKALTGQSDA